MNKQFLFLLRLTTVFTVLAAFILTACTSVTPPDISAAPAIGPGPVIGSEQTERYPNAALTATAQAIEGFVPPRLPTEWIPVDARSPVNRSAPITTCPGCSSSLGRPTLVTRCSAARTAITSCTGTSGETRAKQMTGTTTRSLPRW